ncbi:egg cell-secreted protein 1.3 [Phtheirospermum japonicum]|uniref:Egg cell-secreted protein 1.3 n=1 Tax=Phtheirospermum japonicum TaxID=374723 RepID=A0A830CJT8_9LAMI|nr:egg cell-secreted protein 1.3 [Phtheirospermum japonicum]
MATECLFFLLTVTALMARFSSSQELPFVPLITGLNPIGLNHGREVKEEALDCFSALYKIKSCSKEIVAYFSEGSIDITQPCCEAITLITHRCWPALLSTLGYGQDQIGILRGYCDAVAPDGGGFGPIPSPFRPVPSPFGLPLPVVN